ncbi:hypothetical protein B0J12DRAFT_565056 [Macrophomina phaseolina]|uniref:Major facilitator superfamily transporter n=1 Tax=Macrophomina phaseolina TaxID=35725 RepID=A0ABQ8GPA5_9PEZI|nr:hypothetical protein B0J12DRAFT_565056 [Macrophomina phaseolina]
MPTLDSLENRLNYIPTVRDHQYKKLVNRDEPSSESSDGLRTWALRKTLWHYIILFVIVVSGLFLVGIYAGADEPLYAYDKVDPRSRRCGKTAAEARARGCHFSPVSFAWLPEECMDRELDEEFRNLNWTLYSDVNKTRIKTEDEFADDLTDTFLTNENHVLHCVYSWKRMHRAIIAGKTLHTGLSYHHTEHCGMVMSTRWEDPKAIITRALVIYPGC